VMAPAGVIRPTLAFSVVIVSVNQRLPSGPAVMAKGKLPAGRLNGVTVPLGVMRSMLPRSSTNHKLPSGPRVMPAGIAPGTANSTAAPSGEIRPTFPANSSVNQTFPSGPFVMPKDGPGAGSSVTPIAIRQRASKGSTVGLGRARRLGELIAKRRLLSNDQGIVTPRLAWTHYSKIDR